MRRQWKELGIEDYVWMYEGLDLSDERVTNVLTYLPHRGDAVRKTYTITWGHIDMMERFVYRTDKEYAIFCENDICVSKNLEKDVEWALARMKKHGLDIILLGFLNAVHPHHYPTQYGRHPATDLDVNKPETGEVDGRRLYYYPPEHWGVQMYLITRSYAKHVIDTFTLEYARNTWHQVPGFRSFSPDHTISKLASGEKRAFMFPMAAIEDGTTDYEHSGQHHFHKASFSMYYDPSVYFPPGMGDDEPVVVGDASEVSCPCPRDMVCRFNEASGLEVPVEKKTEYIETRPKLLSLKAALVKEESEELQKAVEEKDPVEMLDALADIMYVVHGFAIAMGWDLEKAFSRVHESNMSKFCHSEEEALQTVQQYHEDYVNGKSPYDTPTYRYNHEAGKWVVFNESSGKILKSIRYHPVNLSDLV